MWSRPSGDRRPCAEATGGGHLDALDLGPLPRFEGGDRHLGTRFLALDIDVGLRGFALDLDLGLCRKGRRVDAVAVAASQQAFRVAGRTARAFCSPVLLWWSKALPPKISVSAQLPATVGVRAADFKL
jgi:hypothetical protein